MAPTRRRFIYNLRSETHDPFTRTRLEPAGYLLAPNNATSTLEALADDIRDDGRQFYVDNGNFTLIGTIRREFSAEARVLWEQVQTLESQLDRTLTASDVPPRLRTDYRDLASRVRARALEMIPEDDAQLSAQLELKPTHLVGVEDLTMASWLSLDIEDEYTHYQRRKYRRMNESVARRAVVALQGVPGRLAKTYYPVASAVSYNTARDAGKIFAQAGIDRIAMGFGAYMADANYTDYAIIERRRIGLDGRAPRRYLRTAAVAAGFWSGYAEERGRPPLGFHFLGLGAPIMMAIAALAAWGTKDLSYDATSPIKDAVEGSLYVSKPAYLKIRTRKVAWRLASEDGERWRCPCPFCTAFVEAHPFDYAAGRSWFEATGPDAIRAADLRPEGGLADAYPLLSEPRETALRQAVNFARIGHNHWALEQILDELNAAAGSRAKLLRHCQAIVADYEAHTNASTYARAVRTGLDLAAGTLR